jgi:hypothetical protein
VHTGDRGARERHRKRTIAEPPSSPMDAFRQPSLVLGTIFLFIYEKHHQRLRIFALFKKVTRDSSVRKRYSSIDPGPRHLGARLSQLPLFAARCSLDLEYKCSAKKLSKTGPTSEGLPLAHLKSTGIIFDITNGIF